MSSKVDGIAKGHDIEADGTVESYKRVLRNAVVELKSEWNENSF